MKRCTHGGTAEEMCDLCESIDAPWCPNCGFGDCGCPPDEPTEDPS